MLRKPPEWRLVWAPRAMRATLESPTGNALIALAPASAEGRHLFGDHATLIEASPRMLAALRNAEQWLGKMIADGGHLRAVAPDHAERTLQQVAAAIARATGAEG